MNLPPRWHPLLHYFQTIYAPLADAGVGGSVVVEGNGPDGSRWTRLDPRFVPLAAEAPALDAVRAVARLCGATRADPDPGPQGQAGRGVYYSLATFGACHRKDVNVLAVAGIALDVDDKSNGGRDGTLRALARVPAPTARVLSGGGSQAVYVLREAVVFDRSRPDELLAACRAYLTVALALESLTRAGEAGQGADATWWPSHLFRCPATYHVKRPEHPVLVRVEIDHARRFNLSDFEDVTGAADPEDVEGCTVSLADRLLGRKTSREIHASLPEGKTMTLPRRVSRAVVRILNGEASRRYRRPDGSLDRSRTVYAVACSLLGAGMKAEDVVGAILASALASVVEDRGVDGGRWLAHQVEAARKYLEGRAADAR